MRGSSTMRVRSSDLCSKDNISFSSSFLSKLDYKVFERPSISISISISIDFFQNERNRLSNECTVIVVYFWGKKFLAVISVKKYASCPVDTTRTRERKGWREFLIRPRTCIACCTANACSSGTPNKATIKVARRSFPPKARRASKN